MCNCGKRRQNPVDASTTPQNAPAPGRPLFEYVGATALTVFGPVSGRRYRFERTGARLTADPRDGNALQTVPLLRLRVSP